MSQLQPPDELEDLLPWHVNQTLKPPQRERVEQLLAQYPASREDLTLLQELAAVMRLEHRHYDEQGTLTRLLSQVHPSAGDITRSERRPPSRSWVDALLAWFEPRFAFAVLTIAVQGIVIGALMNRSDRPQFSEIRSPASAQEATQPIYRVTFVPSASERDVRSLLIAAHARIIDGPTQLGDYYLTSVRSDSVVNETVLRQSELVDRVDKADRIPSQ